VSDSPSSLPEGGEPSSCRYGCEVDGCLAHVDLGDAIHRTSPKGGPFRGRCTRHFREMGEQPDPVAIIIEAHNQDRGKP
jgi:hypothetical protein